MPRGTFTNFPIQLFDVFSPFVRAVDFALDWILLDSGRAVYRQGDMDESMFVVLSGRLRSVANKIVIEEFGRGDVLGMLEMLQKKPRNSTVLAVRFFPIG